MDSLNRTPKQIQEHVYECCKECTKLMKEIIPTTTSKSLIDQERNAYIVRSVAKKFKLKPIGIAKILRIQHYYNKFC